MLTGEDANPGSIELEDHAGELTECSRRRNLPFPQLPQHGINNISIVLILISRLHFESYIHNRLVEAMVEIAVGALSIRHTTLLRQTFHLPVVLQGKIRLLWTISGSTVIVT